MYEPICANVNCKYHKYDIEHGLPYAQVLVEPLLPNTVANYGATVANKTYATKTIKRVPIWRGDRELGLFCEECAKTLFGV